MLAHKLRLRGSLASIKVSREHGPRHLFSRIRDDARAIDVVDDDGGAGDVVSHLMRQSGRVERAV